MSFLQPILLAALPLVALPILIHLINQRRYQTIQWAAMMFLLAANRMSRGYARLRQWLILLFRMLAIATLIFAVSRPLASGWLGLTAGGRADTTIVLLDRSPSMLQKGTGGAGSKLETGRQQLVQTLGMLGSARWILVESAARKPRELESPSQLLQIPETEPSGTSADLPAMLQAAADYIKTNQTGRTEVWICSDIRQNDWNAESSRWQKLRDAFLEFPQSIRFHLLAYPQTATHNVAIRVTNVRWQQTNTGVELFVSLRLTREGNAETQISVPVQFEIDGARSETTVEFAGQQYELKDHRIPLERTKELGWGRVSIPADVNAADNDFYFVFDQPAPRRAILVTDDPQASRPLQIAAAISPEPAFRASAEVLQLNQLNSVEWDKLALVLWHAPLPQGDDATTLKSYVERGGQVVFFPPQNLDSTDFLGVRWQSWVESKDGIAVETWRGDQDLLANTQSGASLPVGKLEIRKHCGLTGDATTLATLKGGGPLLSRVPTDRGGVYFCGTTPAVGDSSLATSGVVLYVMVQRALAEGAAVLGNARQLIAGEFSPSDAVDWRQVAGPKETLSSEFPLHGGVYQSKERLWAVNRSTIEDQAAILPDARVAELFQGLDFVRMDDRPGSFSALIQEIWRLFLISMIVALIVEAALCLPKILIRTASAT